MKSQHTDNDRLSFILAAYGRCFDSKHHYDSLSWVIGGILLVFVGALFAYLPQIKGGFPLWVILVSPQRLVIAFFSWIFLYLWFRIYERNRFWAEVANEKMREFEREFQVEGVGIKFMKANKDGFIILRNMDEKGMPVERESRVLLRQDSMHKVIPWFLMVIGLAIFIACFIP